MESSRKIAVESRAGVVGENARESRENVAPWLRVAWRLYPIALVTFFPVALVSNFWLEVFRGVRSRATDGSGHWGVAQIFNSQIFPDTFGWTGAYLAGMPFPNFYPPLFHWLVGLLNATGLFSSDAAFKLILIAPVLLMPAAVWLLAWRLSERNDKVATAAAAACVLLAVNMRFQTSTCGLDYTSTFVAGFYTQPLGFVLMLAWFVAYARAGERSGLSAAFSCILLALTILANFFNAFTAALLVASTLVFDLLNLKRAKASDARRAARHALVVHFTTPFVALALCLFWLAPMFSTYEFFVTRPLVIPLSKLITPWLWAWYAVAAAGVVLSFKRLDVHARAYLLTLVALAAAVVFASTLAPPWFPLQAFRFLSTLNFMLAVPAGFALAAALEFFRVEVRMPRTTFAVARHAFVVFAALAAFGLLQATRPTGGLAFYTTEENARLEAVLRFAREHRDGRYLVEVLDVVDNPLHADSPALNAYLGAQGNETLGVVYREASPNSLFFNALTNALSEGKDSFGISSVLADDLDFAAQPTARQLERARFAGVRYLVVESDSTKERLAREPAVKTRYDFDRWSIFEIGGGAQPRARALAYRPALVVSGFSVKGRQRDDLDFVRLAEEQFNDGWFDVLLARSTEKKIDRLSRLEQFGALVVDTYDCDDEGRAFELLREFSARRTLVLIEADAPLFRRIRSSLGEFPHARVVRRAIEERESGRVFDETANGRVESFQPSYHYDASSIRRVWREVRAALEDEKVGVENSDASVGAVAGKNELSLTLGARRVEEDVPVLVATTYSPNWRAREGNQVYAATPFFMLTFARGDVHLEYARGATDSAGLWASVAALFGLFGYAFVARRKAKETSVADVEKEGTTLAVESADEERAEL